MDDRLFKMALEAIMALFGDTAQSADETADDLRALRGEIDALLDTLNG